MTSGDESRVRRGDQRLRQALARLRRPHPAAPPLSIEPTNACELAIIEQLRAMRDDVDQLQTRVNWLLGLIIAAAVTNVLLAVLQ